jgi:hypothetical protein
MATVTSERPEVAPEVTETVDHRRPRGLIVIAIVLAAALGFGFGWVAFRDTGSDVPAGVEDVVEDYVEAWNEADGQAALDVMTPAGAHYADNGVRRMGSELRDLIDGIFPTGEFVHGDIESIVGDNPYVVVTSGTVFGTDGFSVFEIVERDGTYRISVHHWVD